MHSDAEYRHLKMPRGAVEEYCNLTTQHFDKRAVPRRQKQYRSLSFIIWHLFSGVLRQGEV